jgi:hypothetical protein
MSPDTIVDIGSRAKQLHKIVAIARLHLVLRSHPKLNVTIVCIGYVLVACVLYYLHFAAPFRLPALVDVGMSLVLG